MVPDENTQMALEWIQEHVPDVVRDGILDDWLEWHEEDCDLSSDDRRDIGDRVIELINNLPKYVEVISMLKKRSAISKHNAIEMARELK